MRNSLNEEAVIRLHKAMEACAIAIAHLAVMGKLKPGNGISTVNAKRVRAALKNLQTQSNRLTTVSRNWMR